MNSFLQDLVDELSVESASDTDKQYSELLDYAIESAGNDVERTLGFMQAITDNFEHHFSNGDESFENYQAYRQSTALIFSTTGVDIPVEIIVPSFESQSFDSYSTEAEEKKKGLMKSAWDGLVKMLKRFWDWVTRKNKDSGEKIEKAVKVIEEAKVEVKAAEVEAKKGEYENIGDVVKRIKDKNKTEGKIIYSLKDVTISANISPSLITGGKFSLEGMFKNVSSSFAVTAIQDYNPSMKAGEVDTKLSSFKALPALEAATNVPLNAGQVHDVINTISLDALSKQKTINELYATKYKTLTATGENMLIKNKDEVEAEGGKDAIQDMRNRNKLFGLIYKDLMTIVTYYDTVATTSKQLSSRLKGMFGSE